MRLGLALFILVGLVYMVSAYWMPFSVRVPHSVEFMADEFVYAGVLTALRKVQCLSAASSVLQNNMQRVDGSGGVGQAA